MSRADWLEDDVMKHILACMTEANKLAIITSLVTGLRIGDVLALRSSVLDKRAVTIHEQKTLKRRVIRLPVRLREELTKIAGKVYIWEHRTDPRRHRSRQAVYKDIKRAARAFRVPLNVSPHSARKIYTVKEFHRDFDIRRVQKLLNHSNEAVTLVYALADQVTAKKKNVSRETMNSPTKKKKRSS